MLVTGPWHSHSGTYTVLMDGRVIATTLVQPGVLRCFVPGIFLLTLNIATNYVHFFRQTMHMKCQYKNLKANKVQMNKKKAEIQGQLFKASLA